jgi:galactokinase/mevalonate kinase-like predicted kinase
MLQRQLMLFLLPTMPNKVPNELQKSFLTGKAETLAHLESIKAYAFATRSALEQGDLEQLGVLLHQTWQEECGSIHQNGHNILEDCYRSACQYGALGGMVTDVGGGGGLLLVCPEVHQPQITQALAKRGLWRLPFVFEPNGVQIIQSEFSDIQGLADKVQVMARPI